MRIQEVSFVYYNWSDIVADVSLTVWTVWLSGILWKYKMRYNVHNAFITFVALIKHCKIQIQQNMPLYFNDTLKIFYLRLYDVGYMIGNED